MNSTYTRTVTLLEFMRQLYMNPINYIFYLIFIQQP